MYQIVIVVKASIKKLRMCLLFKDTDAFHVLLELTRTKIITSKHFVTDVWLARITQTIGPWSVHLARPASSLLLWVPLWTPPVLFVEPASTRRLVLRSAPTAWRASILRAQHRAQFGQILTQTALRTLTRQNRYSLIGEVIVQEQTTSSPRAG